MAVSKSLLLSFCGHTVLLNLIYYIMNFNLNSNGKERIYNCIPSGSGILVIISITLKATVRSNME